MRDHTRPLGFETGSCRNGVTIGINRQHNYKRHFKVKMKN